MSRFDSYSRLCWPKLTDVGVALMVGALIIPFLPMMSAVFANPQATRPATSAQSDNPVFSELAAIMDKQSAAWNRGDIAEFMKPYWRDDRMTFSSGGTTERGWEPTYQRYKKKYPDQATMGKLVFGNLESQELGSDVILMLGTWKLERADPAQGNFSLVWKRIDGQWVIVHDHSSLKAK